MSLKLNKQDLLERAKKYFGHYPKERAFIATSDGQFFLQKDGKAANGHAKANGLETHFVRKEEVFPPTSPNAPGPRYPEGGPTDSWTVKQIEAFMGDHAIEFDSNDRKADLLEKVAAWLLAGDGSTENPAD